MMVSEPANLVINILIIKYEIPLVEWDLVYGERKITNDVERKPPSVSLEEKCQFKRNQEKVGND